MSNLAQLVFHESTLSDGSVGAVGRDLVFERRLALKDRDLGNSRDSSELCQDAWRRLQEKGIAIGSRVSLDGIVGLPEVVGFDEKSGFVSLKGARKREDGTVGPSRIKATRLENIVQEKER